MGEAILRVRFPYQRACDLCHKPRKDLYRIELDNVPVYVCTGSEAVVARDRWLEKKKLNMSPYESKMKEGPMMEQGSIPEPGGEE